MLKPIYFFEEADSKNKTLIGSKGAGLAEMTQLGLSIPPGFIITTEICAKFYEGGKRLPDGFMYEVRKAMKKLETLSKKQFGDVSNPLLVSVRSGAPISMPGMMDTVLNLGINDHTVQGLAKQSKDSRFAWDIYRRFIQMFGKIVLNVEENLFEEISVGAENADEDHLRNMTLASKMFCEKKIGKKFPEDPYKQLELAIIAVFKSWMGKRAIEYRRQYKISPEMTNGTAVTILEMVFGNMGNDSATGVLFTRNPESGEKKLYGEYLVNAQGEDVVSGKATPKPINLLSSELPNVDKELRLAAESLEKHFREPQDVEFTVEKGNLYILQTRSAKMNALASVKTSVDMFHEGLINRTIALARINPEELEQILYPIINDKSNYVPIARGIGASPGAVNGIVVLNEARAESLGIKGEKVILVKEYTKPEDVPALFRCAGIVTSRGGKTSHAAVVARGMGKPCIVGCSQIEIDERASRFIIDGKRSIHEMQKITIDGTSGHIYAGEVPTMKPEITSELKELLQWAYNVKLIEIRANSDVPESAVLARKYGAEGIGLCRTERMFNQHDRIAQFVTMIMADGQEERRHVLAELEPLQRSDFKTILKEMEGLPVTIRLLDPPLHEFLPKEEDLLNQIFELRSQLQTDNLEILNKEKLLKRVHELSEINPMLGHRGVRVGLSFPEIYEIQIRAICEAAAELFKEGIHVQPQIMVPQVGMVEEFAQVRLIFESIKREIEYRNRIKLKIKFGSMIEVVRACLIADDIAKLADFLSFGTNDLTQGTFSFSREDAESKFLPLYLDKGLISMNPFQTIDNRGVGKLMKIAIDLAKGVKRDIEIGICGEHGGDPRSIEFFTEIGLDYVSTSSHRIPIAILAAAQSAINQDDKRPKLYK
ncbi:MAG TPA: pyruvate, phosphate dikinase [Nitrososphaeraceae archaeon]|jgi:pyruvate,orthophosphate dikinase|nr:pyruvate, phosphate dikinase [Nitrososphaeraceae archaeon]